MGRAGCKGILHRRNHRFHCFCCQSAGLGEIEGVAVKGYYCVYGGSRCFCVLPTNHGKTLCYACLPLLFDHLYQLEDSQRSIVIVVTPLAAIMEDIMSLRGLDCVNRKTTTLIVLRDEVAAMMSVNHSHFSILLRTSLVCPSPQTLSLL